MQFTLLFLSAYRPSLYFFAGLPKPKNYSRQTGQDGNFSITTAESAGSLPRARLPQWAGSPPRTRFYFNQIFTFPFPTGFPECVEMSTNKYVEFRRECEESHKNLCARIKCFQWKLRTPWTKRGAFLVWLLTLCSESRKGAGKYSAGRRKSSKPTRGLCFVALAGASWLSPASHLRQNNSTHFRK